jgi:CBS domain containing-hemolysin-like protein
LDPAWPNFVALPITLIINSVLARLGAINNGLGRSNVERLAEAGVPRASLLLSMFNPRNVFGQAIMTGQITTLAVGCILFLRVTGPIRAVIHTPWQALDGCITTAFFVFVALLLTNLTPPYRREEGSEAPLPRIITAGYPIYLLFLLPAILLQKAQHMFVSEDDNRAIKEDELRNIVESETDDGTIEVEEREMIEGIFEFGDTTVKEVMIPRIDMLCASITGTREELLDVVVKSRHSRIPVFEERVDHIKGIVYVKDLLHAVIEGREWAIQDIMREPYFVPENKNIDDLLTDFKSNRVHMAIVLDEYGGTSGLVTLEDLIEEIFGEIQDEYDDEDPLFEWAEDGTLTADARIAIDDLNLLLNVELPQEGYETLGGFVYNHLGHVPESGEAFTHGDLSLVIEDVTGQRITNVKIVKVDNTEESLDAPSPGQELA